MNEKKTNVEHAEDVSLVSVLVLIKQGDEFVLQHRDDIPDIANPGLVAPWGGAVEGDEDLKDAVVREFIEETGVTLHTSQVHELAVFTEQGGSPGRYGKEITVHTYYAEIDPSITVNCYEGQGIVRVKNLDEVPPKLISTLLRQTVEAYIAKIQDK